jgi:hypothetical protein
LDSAQLDPERAYAFDSSVDLSFFHPYRSQQWDETDCQRKQVSHVHRGDKDLRISGVGRRPRNPGIVAESQCEKNSAQRHTEHVSETEDPIDNADRCPPMLFRQRTDHHRL